MIRPHNRTFLKSLFSLLSLALYAVVLWGQATAPIHLLAHEHTGDSGLAAFYQARARQAEEQHAREHEHGHDHNHDHDSTKHHHSNDDHKPHPATEHKFLLEPLVEVDSPASLFTEVHSTVYSTEHPATPPTLAYYNHDQTRGPPHLLSKPTRQT